MGLTVCPTARISAPLELVWANLVEWERYSNWTDVHPERIEPEGAATAGQTVYFAGNAFGRTWRFMFKVETVDHERHRLDLRVFFPFGLQEKPHIACDRIDATTCQVKYG